MRERRGRAARLCASLPASQARGASWARDVERGRGGGRNARCIRGRRGRRNGVGRPCGRASSGGSGERRNARTETAPRVRSRDEGAPAGAVPRRSQRRGGRGKRRRRSDDLSEERVAMEDANDDHASDDRASDAGGRGRRKRGPETAWRGGSYKGHLADTPEACKRREWAARSCASPSTRQAHGARGRGTISAEGAAEAPRNSSAANEGNGASVSGCPRGRADAGGGYDHRDRRARPRLVDFVIDLRRSAERTTLSPSRRCFFVARRKGIERSSSAVAE